LTEKLLENPVVPSVKLRSDCGTACVNISVLHVVEEVTEFFTSLRLECGELSRDSHISALVFTVRTAIARLRSPT